MLLDKVLEPMRQQRSDDPGLTIRSAFGISLALLAALALLFLAVTLLVSP